MEAQSARPAAGRRHVVRAAARVLVAAVAVAVAVTPALVQRQGASAQMNMPMPMPMHAPKEMVTTMILLPKPGQTVTADSVPVVPEFTHWKLDCNLVGRPPVPGTGHFHVYLDGVLAALSCGPTAVSMQNVTPGLHNITVIPAENDHTTVDSAKATVFIDYKPTPGTTLPWISSGPAGTPSLHISSPTNGATVHGGFPLVVMVNHFLVSCDLTGKAPVPNAGYWQATLDTLKGPMMGMAHMLGNSCTNYLNISTEGMSKGQHTFYALLVDTRQQPLSPNVIDKVTVNVQ